MFEKLWNRIRSAAKALWAKLRRPDPTTSTSAVMGMSIGRSVWYAGGIAVSLVAGLGGLALVLGLVWACDLWFHLWAAYHLAVYSVVQPALAVR